MYKLQYSQVAKETIEKLQEKKKRQVKSAIERLANDPFYGKPLDGLLKGYCPEKYPPAIAGGILEFSGGNQIYYIPPVVFKGAAGLCRRGSTSYRSGDYRIIYKIIRNEITIMIMYVGHRGSVYEVFTRKVKGIMLNEELLAYGTKLKRKKKKQGQVCMPNGVK